MSTGASRPHFTMQEDTRKPLYLLRNSSGQACPAVVFRLPQPTIKRIAGAAGSETGEEKVGRGLPRIQGKPDLNYVDEAMSQSSKLLAQPADEACINFGGEARPDQPR